MTDTLTALPDAASTGSATNPGITSDAAPGITANADSTASPAPASLPAPAPATPTTDDLIQEGQRLGGPLGGSLLSMTAAAAKHIDDHGTPSSPAQSAAPSAPKDPQQVMKDPKFLSLPAEDQQSVLAHIDPKFAALPAEDQQSVIAHLQSVGKTPPDPQVSLKQKY
jgi:hypothetical protein